MKTRILVVDDEALVREVLGAALGSEGYAVGFAASGEEAIRALGPGSAIDLVVLDWRMPGMDGAGVLRAMAGIAERPPVILLTGAVDEELAEIGKTGCAPAAVLRKPIHLADLFSTVASVMSGVRRPAQP